MRITTRIVYSIALMFVLVTDGATRENRASRLLTDNSGSNRFFIVDKNSSPVYATLDKSVLTESRPIMGEIYFAIEETDTRVLVGFYGPWRDIGWMNKQDLLDNISLPVTLGGLRRKGEELGFDAKIAEYNKVADGSRRNDALFVRALTQPERQATLGLFPGDKSGGVLKVWGWHYVFDVEIYDGVPWILMGKISTMFGTGGRPSNSSDRSSKLNFVGWVPLDHVSIWATNIALELNTHKDSIAYRVRKNAPATIFQHRVANSNVDNLSWVEPLKLLYGKMGETKTKEVQADPKGLAPEYPRMVVFDRVDSYTRVATGVSTTGGLTFSEISRARAQRDNMRQMARSVDVVFLIDQSGSMNDDIVEVRNTLTSLVFELKKVVLEDLRADDPYLQLEVNVSVVGYGRRIHRHLSRTSIYNLKKIQGAFNRVRSGTVSGEERMHDALVGVIRGKFMGDETMRRFIVLLTDEPGVTPATDQQRVFAVMPDLSNDLRIAGETVGWTGFRGWSAEKRKRHRTRILSLFTARSSGVMDRRSGDCNGLTATSCYSRFLYNVGDVSYLTKHATNLTEVKSMFIEFVREIKTDVADLAVALEEEFAVAGEAALPGIQKAEMEEMRQRSGGMSWRELRDATEIGYVDGYIRNGDILSDLERFGSEEEMHSKGWRQRVLVARDDFFALRDQTARLANVLDTANKRYDWEVEIEKMLDARIDENTARKTAMAEIFVTALQALGLMKLNETKDGQSTNTRVGTRDIARSIVELAEKRCDEDVPKEECHGNRTLREFASRAVQLPAALPFDVDGILSLPLIKVLRKDTDWMHRQASILRQKAAGLKLIGEGYWVPDWRAELGTAEVTKKEWYFKVETAPNVAYLHIPLSYIP